MCLLIPAQAVEVLAPGGLVLVEGLTCTTQHGFEQFMARMRKVGAVAIGRLIKFIHCLFIYLCVCLFVYLL